MSQQKEKLHTGELYLPDDSEIMVEQNKCQCKIYDFNMTRPDEGEKRTKMLQDMFAEIGEGCYIEPPLHANWGGHFVHFGKNIYANYNLTMVDDTHIYVGDNTMFGPNVILATAGHPILPVLREQIYQYNMPIHIGRNCWLGAGVIVLPGITIGDNSVIGAGSVVTKDIPDNVVAVGNPCRVLRKISDHDKEFYFKDRKMDPYVLCPTLETESFTYRLIQKEDSDALFTCYHDKAAVELMNDDNCDFGFYVDTKEKMAETVEYWIDFYKKRGFIRFSIVDKTTDEAVGTMEGFGGETGVLRVDLASPYEKEHFLSEIVTMAKEKFYEIFGNKYLVTKAVKAAVERRNALEKCGWKYINTFREYEEYYKTKLN